MVAAAQRLTGPSEWVKWVAGIALMLNGVVFGYAISIEHRLTKTEEGHAAHVKAAAEDKAAIQGQLKQQDETNKQVLAGITAVQVEVAKITGYMERSKSAN